MRSLRSFSAAPDVPIWLASTRDPRILHVFGRACNLIDEQKEVISVVTGEIGNGPFNLVLEERVWFPEHLRIDSPVHIVEDHLIVGDLSITMSTAICWSPCPDWEKLHVDREKIVGQLARLPLVPCQSPPLIASQLSKALVSEDIPSSKASASRLAGLGAGLTPAGDDYILGALYATWIIHPLDTAGPLVREVANTAAPLTTSLSAAWLKSAAKGQAGAVWHEFFDALAFSNPVQIQSAMQKITAVGATSGLEALTGFLATFHSYAEIHENYVLPRSI